MTGLDKIIEKIGADSKADCERILADAQKAAQETELSAVQECERLTAETIELARENALEIVRRGESAAAQLERQTLLRYRTQAVDTVLAHAVEELKSMDAAEYFIALETLASKYALPGTGVMYLNGRDLAAMPAGFSERLSAALPQGSKIIISNEPRQLDSGFVLVYGDIDINCTFDALAQEKRDELKEKICEIIF